MRMFLALKYSDKWDKGKGVEIFECQNNDKQIKDDEHTLICNINNFYYLVKREYKFLPHPRPHWEFEYSYRVELATFYEQHASLRLFYFFLDRLRDILELNKQ